MPYDSREYNGASPATTLASGIDAVVTSITLTDGTGWPTGGTGNFHITIDRGLSNEERIKCSARTGNVLSVVGSGRGVDNTTAATHAQNAIVEHTLAAIDLSEANQHYANTALDHHTQYTNIARHDVSTRHVFGSALANPAAATTSSVGQAAAAGAATGPSRADHTHGRESFATPVAVAFANAAGSAVTIPRSDHVHAAVTRKLGYAQVTADQLNIPNTITNLTGLSVTVTVGTARTVKITGHYLASVSTAGADYLGDVSEGGVALSRISQFTGFVAVSNTFQIIADGSYVYSPSAGSHTYQLRLQKTPAGGVLDMLAGATYPAWILVEDIT